MGASWPEDVVQELDALCLEHCKAAATVTIDPYNEWKGRDHNANLRGRIPG